MLAATAFIANTESPRRHRRRSNDLDQSKDFGWFGLRYIGHIIVANIYAFAFVSYSLWTVLGILFYKYYDGYTFATAYYYAMEAGLSIGFCEPSEIDDWSRLFTIFYVLLGSSVVSGAIGIMAAVMISTRSTLVPAEHFVGAFTPRDETGKLTVGSVSRFCWYHVKLFCGWYSNRALTSLVLLFIIWVAWGSAFVAWSEGYSGISAVYWAITTIATGGLMSPACLDGTSGPTCDLGVLRGGVMGLYMQIGVPLYAVTLAQVSRFAVSYALREREDQLLNKPIEDADFLFAANILSPEGSTTLVLGEYILLELMRLGVTDQAQIESMKRKFVELDRHKRDELDIDDLRAKGLVVPRKLHSVEVARRIRTRSIELFDSFLHAVGTTPLRGNHQRQSPQQRHQPSNMSISSLSSSHDEHNSREQADGDIELATFATSPRKVLHAHFDEVEEDKGSRYQQDDKVSRTSRNDKDLKHNSYSDQKRKPTPPVKDPSPKTSLPPVTTQANQQQQQPQTRGKKSFRKSIKQLPGVEDEQWPVVSYDTDPFADDFDYNEDAPDSRSPAVVAPPSPLPLPLAPPRASPRESPRITSTKRCSPSESRTQVQIDQPPQLIHSYQHRAKQLYNGNNILAPYTKHRKHNDDALSDSSYHSLSDQEDPADDGTGTTAPTTAVHGGSQNGTGQTEGGSDRIRMPYHQPLSPDLLHPVLDI